MLSAALWPARQRARVWGLWGMIGRRLSLDNQLQIRLFYFFLSAGWFTCWNKCHWIIVHWYTDWYTTGSILYLCAVWSWWGKKRKEHFYAHFRCFFILCFFSRVNALNRRWKQLFWIGSDWQSFILHGWSAVSAQREAVCC